MTGLQEYMLFSTLIQTEGGAWMSASLEDLLDVDGIDVTLQKLFAEWLSGLITSDEAFEDLMLFLEEKGIARWEEDDDAI